MTSKNIKSLLKYLKEYIDKSRPAYKDYIGQGEVEKTVKICEATLSDSYQDYIYYPNITISELSVDDMYEVKIGDFKFTTKPIQLDNISSLNPDYKYQGLSNIDDIDAVVTAIDNWDLYTYSTDAFIIVISTLESLPERNGVMILKNSDHYGKELTISKIETGIANKYKVKKISEELLPESYNQTVETVHELSDKIGRISIPDFVITITFNNDESYSSDKTCRDLAKLHARHDWGEIKDHIRVSYYDTIYEVTSVDFTGYQDTECVIRAQASFVTGDDYAYSDFDYKDVNNDDISTLEATKFAEKVIFLTLSDTNEPSVKIKTITGRFLNTMMPILGSFNENKVFTNTYTKSIFIPAREVPDDRLILGIRIDGNSYFIEDINSINGYMNLSAYYYGVSDGIYRRLKVTETESDYSGYEHTVEIDREIPLKIDEPYYTGKENYCEATIGTSSDATLCPAYGNSEFEVSNFIGLSVKENGPVTLIAGNKVLTLEPAGSDPEYYDFHYLNYNGQRVCTIVRRTMNFTKDFGDSIGLTNGMKIKLYSNTIHQIPSKYLPVDNETITINDKGQLTLAIGDANGVSY